MIQQDVCRKDSDEWSVKCLSWDVMVKPRGSGQPIHCTLPTDIHTYVPSEQEKRWQKNDEIPTSRLRTCLSTDSSTSAAQIVVKLDKIDAGGGTIGKLAKKLSKSQRIVKKSKKPSKVWKIYKDHRFRGTFTEAPILCQLETKNSSF